MTREEAWKKAVDDALASHVATTKRDQHGRTVKTEELLGGLYAGVRVIREKMTADTLRSNDLVQLVAMALDCLGAAYYDAAGRGEEPKRPSEVRN